MRIVEIKSIGNNAHRNQSGNIKIIPEGWAVVPVGLDTPNFPFGELVAEEIDGVMTVTKWTPCSCPEPEPPGDPAISTDLGSYYAFCANANSDSIDCAFGKNNEDRIINLGLQLAMYSWFKDNSKTDYPFTELCKCCKLTSIESNNAAFKELWENLTLRDLYMRGDALTGSTSAYPCNRVMSVIARTSTELELTFEITEEDINAGFVWFAFKAAANTYKSRDLIIYLNDVPIIEYLGLTGAQKWNEGHAIKLSDCGITTPGSYTLKRNTVDVSGWGMVLYRKTASE